ncbi:MAG: aquaporin [Candidatus Nomurabacteria bacterium]|jgi:glycerol uptake facilitator-like aquaporin|nr:aquaporin [Candidatus Nomurabacteria bacterium]
MATKKAKKPVAKSAKTAKPVAKGETTVNITEVNETVIIASPAKESGTCEPKGALCGFFKKKHEDEDILTIFRSPRIIGAILGEIIGTMLLSIAVLAMGFEPIYLVFVFLFVTLVVYPISGAHLNPIVSLGAMVTRRISAIRGIFYIIAQLIGAMLGWLIVQWLIGMATSDASSTEITATTIKAITDNDSLTGSASNLGGLIAVEAIGAVIYGFAFARAFKFKKSAFTFAAVVATGVFTALLIGLFVSYQFFGVQGTFAFNPALAVALEAFMAQDTIVWKALITYALVPLVAGVVGFILADLTAALAGESCDCEK